MFTENIDVSIVKINHNKVFKCENDCYRRKKCDVKSKFSISTPSVNSLTATEIIVDIHNRTNSMIETHAKEWYGIDEKSYSWQSQEICDEIWSGRCLHFCYGLVIPPNCTIRVYLYFPEMTDKVISVLYLTKNCTLEVSSKASKGGRNTNSLNITKSDPRIKSCVNRLNELEQLYARRVFAFTANTIENVGLDIASKQVEIRQMIDELPASIREVVRGWVEEIETKGERDLRTARELLDLSNADSISHLLSLSPRDFEEWTGDLFRALGYETQVTPYQGDGGLDIVCTKDSVTIGVQCKRYNGIVFDSLIYAFHKALDKHGIKVGYFITTGFFSVTAINMASKYGIKLYDRTNLADLIKNALK